MGTRWGIDGAKMARRREAGSDKLKSRRLWYGIAPRCPGALRKSYHLRQRGSKRFKEGQRGSKRVKEGQRGSKRVKEGQRGSKRVTESQEEGTVPHNARHGGLGKSPDACLLYVYIWRVHVYMHPLCIPYGPSYGPSYDVYRFRMNACSALFVI